MPLPRIGINACAIGEMIETEKPAARSVGPLGVTGATSQQCVPRALLQLPPSQTNPSKGRAPGIMFGVPQGPQQGSDNHRSAQIEGASPVLSPRLARTLLPSQQESSRSPFSRCIDQVDKPTHMKLSELGLAESRLPPPPCRQANSSKGHAPGIMFGVPQRPQQGSDNHRPAQISGAPPVLPPRQAWTLLPSQQEGNRSPSPQSIDRVGETTHRNLSEPKLAEAASVQNPYLAKIDSLRDKFRGHVDIWPVTVNGVNVAHIFDSCKERTILQGRNQTTTLFVACHGSQDGVFSFNSKLPIVFTSNEGNELRSSGSIDYAEKLFNLKVHASRKETSFKIENSGHLCNEHYLSSGIRATPGDACEMLRRHGEQIENPEKHQPLSVLLLNDGEKNISLNNLISAIHNDYGDKFSRLYSYFCRPVDGSPAAGHQEAADDFRSRRQARLTKINK